MYLVCYTKIITQKINAYSNVKKETKKNESLIFIFILKNQTSKIKI